MSKNKNKPSAPYGRKEHSRNLITNALTKPTNLALLVAIFAAGTIVGAPLILTAGLAGLIYMASSVRTLLDEDESQKVLAKHTNNGKRLAADNLAGVTGMTVLSPSEMSPEIRSRVEAIRQRHERIKQAIEMADLDYVEVGTEIDMFVHEAERSALGAQHLQQVIDDSPSYETRDRLEHLERKIASGKASMHDEKLAEALREQLKSIERIEKQLENFHAQMDRLCVELDTVRANILSTSVTTDAANQRELAANVKGLREEMSNLALGVEEAYSA